MKKVLSIAALVALLGGAALALAHNANSARPDCPGQIVCPLTGELVCKDKCPVGKAPACCAHKAARQRSE